MRKFFVSILEIFEIALITVGTVFLVRTYLVQPFLVSGSSMVPNFQNGDYLLVNELTYRFRTPTRGEVIVFRYPKDESTFFIKRVIGLPGETVQVENNKVTIYNSTHPNGFALDETYLPSGLVTSGSENVKLGLGEYFVLGDNRPFSYDSRAWGVVKTKEIIGLAEFRLWPVQKAQAFSTPQY